MSDELPEGITRGRLSRAEEGDRIKDDYGDTWIVIESKVDNEKHVVRPDVVEYGQYDHPALTGAGAFATIVFALVGPLLAVWMYGPALPAAWGLLVTGGAAAVGYGAARLLLMRTFVGEFVARFMEWNEHRAILEGRDIV